MSTSKEQLMNNAAQLSVPQPTQVVKAKQVASPEQTPSQSADGLDLRPQEHVEKEGHTARRGWGSYSRVAGVGGLLYVVGMIFLLQNFGLLRLENWWALFILMLAFGSFAATWMLFRANNNRFPVSARASLVVGAILFLLAFIFLAGWSFALVWPLFLIVGGLAILSTLVLPRA